MSIHSDLMHAATEVLTAVQGEPSAVVYRSPGGQPFPWRGASCGAIHGWHEDQLDGGDMLKVFRLAVTGPTADLVAGGVSTLERDAIVEAVGYTDWTVSLAESTWGPNLVRLMLVRRPISRHENMERG